MKMPTLSVSDLKERTTNLKEDAYVANAKENAILLLPPNLRGSKGLQ